MNNEELWQQCLTAAWKIVAAEKDAWNGVDAQAFDVNVGGGTSEQSFQRTGTSSQEKAYNLPSNLASLIEQNYLSSGVPASTASAELSFLDQMLALVPELLPNLGVLNSAAGTDPATFTGSGTLNNIAARDPFSTNWENQTQGLYERTMDIGRAQALSGPDAVRGGQARAGYEAADAETQIGLNRFKEVSGVQRQEAGVVDDAIRTANAIEQARRGTAMQAQNQQVQQEVMRRGQQMGVPEALARMRSTGMGQMAMGSEFLAKPKMTTTDNLAGKGNQSTFNWGAGAGLTCCWIFLAAHGGELPWWVRTCRDSLGTDATRRGYKRMAKWLVPLMARWSLVRVAVEATMTWPMAEYGGYLLSVPGKETGWFYRPVKRFWFAVWNRLGKE